ncbi:hypothetical protein B0T10DRAFT_445509 [Thelonectria olida]|uniref:Uncharacterized protein n=1 Tax=Thelonectria olida TaxID=1576542 RepID=A0A9P9AP72_9HYPO|nr:hypothetical protein B0T10DRAFT_445509 [Thelonectria olida]
MAIMARNSDLGLSSWEPVDLGACSSSQEALNAAETQGNATPPRRRSSTEDSEVHESEAARLRTRRQRATSMNACAGPYTLIDESIHAQANPSFESTSAESRSSHDEPTKSPATVQKPHSPNAVCAILRKLVKPISLHSLRTYFKTFNAPEPPKEVCSKSKSFAFRHVALFHLPALAVTLTLLYLYVIECRWPLSHPTAEELATLQFAAKAHEVLILISLTDILLYRICYGLLVETSGIPLGFISSPFHLGSPIQYLLSWEFWAALRCSATTHTFHKITGAAILVVGLLCIGASPFSAIVMIPRQGWWDIGRGNGVVYLNHSLYGMDLDSRHVPQNLNIGNDTGCTHAECLPSRQLTLQNLYGAIHDNQSPLLFNVEQHTIKYVRNITYTYYHPQRSTSQSPRPISLSTDFGPYNWFSTVAVATCPMSFLSSVSSLLDFATVVSGDGFKRHPGETLQKFEQLETGPVRMRKWKQPLVAVNCAQRAWAEKVVSFYFVSELFNKTISLDIDEHAGLKDLVKDVEGPPGPVGYRFLNLADNMSLPISANILFASRVGKNDSSHITLSLCLVSARWVEADLWMDSTTSGIIQSHLNISFGDFAKSFRDASEDTQVIKLRNGWLNGIGAPTNKTAASSAYDLISRYCDTGEGFKLYCLPIALASHITDALAQPGDTSVGIGATGNMSSRYYLTRFEKRFAYSFQNGSTIPVAFASLLLHCLAVVIHLALVVSSKHPWHGTGWGSFGQMMVLALRSRVLEELGNVGGGVASSQTWRKTAMVRAVGEDGQLEIVLGETKGVVESEAFQELEDGRKNGKTERKAHRVEAGVKYS